MSIVALLQGWREESRVLRVVATASFWKSRSSFTSGLLDRSTEAQPLNAASPRAPVTPLIITTEPLRRASALAGSWARHRAGAADFISARVVFPSVRGAGRDLLVIHV